jgi:peptidoglycan/xylan/chitin deacetylase (PgdA/CDA1 family)
MKTNLLFIAFCAFVLSACHSASSKTESPDFKKRTGKAIDSVKQNKSMVTADAATILAKREVPVLCFHHIREPKPGQSETFKSYSVSPTQFADLMKALKDSGYTTILPDQLYDYLLHDGSLPAKPVMLTFDDTDEEQFSIAYQEMKKYGFKGVFFIMTVSINRPRYMTAAQLQELSTDGNAVESHTWDHQMVTKYQGEDWEKQLVQPRKKIESITGKTAKYFAYPFGLWNRAAFPELSKAGYKMAFSLSTKRDSTQPLYTVRRMIVPGQWSTRGSISAMKKTFHLDK